MHGQGGSHWTLTADTRVQLLAHQLLQEASRLSLDIEMSSTSSEDTQLVELISSGITGNRVNVAVAAMVSYEYMITFKHEITFFWMRKKSTATWLFLSIRYLVLLNYVFLVTATLAPMSDKSCTMLEKVSLPIQIIPIFLMAAFSGLRALALSNMNKPLAAIAFVLACGPFAVNLWVESSLGVLGESVPRVGCAGYFAETAAETLIAVSVSRSTLLAADLLVLAVTLRYTLHTRGIRRMAGSNIGSLGNVMVMNGVVYFSVLTTLTTLQITLTLLSVVQAHTSASYVTPLADPLSALLICRFLLNLQSANQKAIDPSLSALTPFGDESNGGSETLRFASGLIGPIGGTIETNQSESMFEDWEEEDKPANQAEEADTVQISMRHPENGSTALRGDEDGSAPTA